MGALFVKDIRLIGALNALNQCIRLSWGHNGILKGRWQITEWQW